MIFIILGVTILKRLLFLRSLFFCRKSMHKSIVNSIGVRKVTLYLYKRYGQLIKMAVINPHPINDIKVRFISTD